MLTLYRVCTAPGDRVPGPRSHALLAPVEFPWKSSVDHIEEVGSHHSFSLSLELCRQGLVCGPSSGFNLQGLYQLIEKRKADGSLANLRNRDGEIHCVFLCCDLPYQYINEYFDKLGDEHFPTIHNKVRVSTWQKRSFKTNGYFSLWRRSTCTGTTTGGRGKRWMPSMNTSTSATR